VFGIMKGYVNVKQSMKGLHYVYSSPHIISTVRLRWVRWVVHVACMSGEKRLKIFV
jgi:hypothetical protein